MGRQGLGAGERVGAYIGGGFYCFCFSSFWKLVFCVGRIFQCFPPTYPFRDSCRLDRVSCLALRCGSRPPSLYSLIKGHGLLGSKVECSQESGPVDELKVQGRRKTAMLDCDTSLLQAVEGFVASTTYSKVLVAGPSMKT